jgi:pentatricopeptide repeat protein
MLKRLYEMNGGATQCNKPLITLVHKLAEKSDIHKLDEVLAWWRPRADSLSLDGRAFSTLIGSLVKKGLINKAELYFEEMQRAGFKPCVYAFTSLIGAYADAAQTQQVMRYFQMMKRRRVTPNVVTYSAIIKAFARNNQVDQMMYFYELMREQGIAPNVVVFNEILKKFTADCDMATAQHIYKELCFNVKPLVKTIALLIRGYTRAIPAAKKSERVAMVAAVETLLLEMDRWCLRRNDFICNHLIVMYGKQKQMAKMSAQYRYMCDHGLVRSLFTYTALLEAYSFNRRFKECFKIYDKIKQSHAKELRYSDTVFVMMLDTCGFTRRVDALESVWTEFTQQFGIHPNSNHYATRIEAYMRSNATSKALDAYFLMRDKKVVPSFKCVQMLLKFFLNTPLYATEAKTALFDLERCAESLNLDASKHSTRSAGKREKLARDSGTNSYSMTSSASPSPSSPSSSFASRLQASHGKAPAPRVAPKKQMGRALVPLADLRQAAALFRRANATLSQTP